MYNFYNCEDEDVGFPDNWKMDPGMRYLGMSVSVVGNCPGDALMMNQDNFSFGRASSTIPLIKFNQRLATKTYSAISSKCLLPEWGVRFGTEGGGGG